MNDSFYEDLEGFHAGPEEKIKKHASPTTRLRHHKNSTVEHKDMIRKSLKRNSDYSLTYCLSPDKAYVVESEGGELNYEEAYTNKNKFVSKVLNRDDTETIVKRKSIAPEVLGFETKRVSVLDTEHDHLGTHRKSLGMMQTVKRRSMSMASLSSQASQRKSMITKSQSFVAPSVSGLEA